MSSVLSDKHFHDEAAAYAFVEARIWANGVTCPHCGKVKDAQPSAQRKGRPYIGKGRGPAGKRAILGLVERGGRVRTFHVAQASKMNVAKLVTENVRVESILMTDESRLYHGMGDV